MSVLATPQMTLDGRDARTWHGGLYYWRTVNQERRDAGKPPLRQVISTGRGTQTNCLYAMVKEGVIEAPAEAGFFGDTMNEPSQVYAYARALEDGTIPVFEASKGALMADELRVHLNKDGEPYLRSNVPYFILRPDGQVGRGMRKCTYDYKIRPAQLAMEAWAGIEAGSRHEPELCVWLGITTDEAHRADPSQWGRAVNRFPLIEMGMSRQDCLDWMEARGYAEPPRSACIACPNRTDTGWLLMLADDPSAFKAACNYERHLQRLWAGIPRLTGVPFLHRSCKPLAEVEFAPVRGEPALAGCNDGVCDV